MDGIPDAVAQQAAEADAALEAESQTRANGAPMPPQPQTVQAGPDSGNQPPHQPVAPVMEGNVVTIADLGRASAPAAPGTQQPPAPTTEQQLEQANQRWRTAQGMIAAKDKELADLRAKPPEAAQPPPPPPQAFSGDSAYQSHLTEEEREDYDSRDDALGISGRAVLGIIEAEFAGLRKALEGRIDTLDQYRLESEHSEQEDLVWSAVEAISPGARDINQSTNPTWLEYLGGPDPNNPGRTLQESAQTFYQAGAIRDLAAIVDDYKQQYGWSPQDSSTVNSDMISGQFKPARTSGSSAPVAQQKPLIPESEVEKFYADRVKGVYDGRDEEVKTIEAAIEEAAAEGRILVGT